MGTLFGYVKCHKVQQLKAKKMKNDRKKPLSGVITLLTFLWLCSPPVVALHCLVIAPHLTLWRTVSSAVCRCFHCIELLVSHTMLVAEHFFFTFYDDFSYFYRANALDPFYSIHNIHSCLMYCICVCVCVLLGDGHICDTPK